MRQSKFWLILWVIGWLGMALLAACQASPPKPQEFAFFSYLKATKPEPALVAYSPTNHDPRPATRRVPPLESIRADLEALRPAFDGLVLYGYDTDTTPNILAEAQRQNYRAVLLGIWDVKSSVELEGTMALIKQYKDKLALAVCIGNEGIQFNRYQLSDLQAAEAHLRKLSGGTWTVPYTTSEPFGQYQQADIKEFGNFVAPNVHPFFDHPELKPDAAAAYVRQQTLMLAQAARKPCLVKETGLPHGGAEGFTPDTQRAFWAAYTTGARFAQVEQQSAWVSYAAAFEAFNLPWKAVESGLPVEGNWGLLTNPERQPLPAFAVWRDLRLRAVP